MEKIKAADLIDVFVRMYKEHWSYILGFAREGCVDCSGAFVWAFRLFHKTIAHGSNAIARKHCGELLPISEAAPGMAAFKYRPPGHSSWALPSKYKSDTDQNDYYHIGLVDSTGKYVLNAQSASAGFTRTRISAWGKVAYLNAVEYNSQDRKENQSMQTMVVNCPDGETVRLRAKPSKNSDTLAKVPSGAVVQGQDYDLEWSRVDWNGKSGYMMDQYLTPIAPTSESFPTPPVATATDLPMPSVPPVTPNPTSVTYNDVLISLPLDVAAKLLEALTKVMGVG